MTIKVYEPGLRAERCKTELLASGLLAPYKKAVLLPIPSSTDGVTVRGAETPIEDAISELCEGDLLVCYGIGEELCARLSLRGVSVCDCSVDEEFLEENARLTAIATLGILLTSERQTPGEKRIGIVGYGRIGRWMSRLLLYLGADLTVYTSRRGVQLDLAEMGISTRESSALASLSDIDILINTAPVRIFDTDEGKFPSGIRVIDLASGVNFPGLPNVERYPSVPARMFPESAGHAWFASVRRFLLNSPCGFGGEEND